MGRLKMFIKDAKKITQVLIKESLLHRGRGTLLIVARYRDSPESPSSNFVSAPLLLKPVAYIKLTDTHGLKSNSRGGIDHKSLGETRGRVVSGATTDRRVGAVKNVDRPRALPLCPGRGSATTCEALQFSRCLIQVHMIQRSRMTRRKTTAALELVNNADK
ncbi:hypothetical protein J6590_060045 [Homalodisca vitripennis]|nr:hypothetical protein J6590_060045 [Homalodisca vitripennis]